MKYKINYGNSVAVLPKSALEAALRAGEVELKVLLCLCSSGGSVDIKKLSRQIGCAESDVKEAISFWRGSGVVELCGEEASQAQETDAVVEPVAQKTEQESAEKKSKSEKKMRRSDELPNYTSDELADILEGRKDTATLINECQHIAGKIFNVREVNIIIGLVDYLGLDFEYILELLTYCASIGKKSLHYVEKTAFELYDLGITEGVQLTEELRRRELAAECEGKIRNLFGVGARAFTTKEKKFISAWINDMKYPFEIIEKAYEVTADATGNASMPYANSVLERWNAAGYKTLEEIERAAEEYRSRESAKTSGEGSFDTDSFFAAAVKRSLGGS